MLGRQDAILQTSGKSGIFEKFSNKQITTQLLKNRAF